MRNIGTNNVGTIRRWGQGTSYGAGVSAVQLADWRLATSEAASAVEAAGYFNILAGSMKVGELIFASLGLGASVATRLYIVTANDGTNVTVARENVTGGAGLTTLAFFFNQADIANGDLLTNYVPGYAFKIEKVDWRQQKAVTTAAKLATLNLEIGTTNVTGGVISLTSAACTPAGVAVAGTAVTADNVGSATDSFSIEASSVTAFVEGSGWLLIQIRNLEG